MPAGRRDRQRPRTWWAQAADAGRSAPGWKRPSGGMFKAPGSRRKRDLAPGRGRPTDRANRWRSRASAGRVLPVIRLNSGPCGWYSSSTRDMAEDKSDKTAAHRYDESKIQTLSSIEHIRKRTGMYIGRLGDGSNYDDGVYILLKEVIDNAVDEFIMGHGREVRITIENGTVSVRDFGRGIPLGKVVDCVSQINTGAKYNNDVFQ